MGHYKHFPENVYHFTWQLVIRCSSSLVQEQSTTARRFFQDAVFHTRSFIPKTLLNLAIQDKTNVLCMTVCRWSQLIVLVCVLVNQYFGHFAVRGGGGCVAYQQLFGKIR
jgi:hypothetical protein